MFFFLSDAVDDSKSIPGLLLQSFFFFSKASPLQCLFLFFVVSFSFYVKGQVWRAVALTDGGEMGGVIWVDK